MADKTFQAWKKKLLHSALEKKAFAYGHFELTGRCNLDCKMCYVHTLDTCAARQKELTTEQWKQVFDGAIAAGMLFANLSGGECLLREDFKELYLHLWNKRIYITVLTNGVMIDEDYAAFFKEHRPERIQISLYGVSEEGYLRVTGYRRFERVVNAIQTLKDAGIDVRVTVTPSQYIKDEYIDIFKFCREHNIHCETTEIMLLPNRENPDKNDYYLTRDEAVALSVGLTELFEAPVPVAVTPEPKGSESCPKQGLRCSAGNCTAAVTWDGKMRPCVSAVIGEGADVRELGFAKAWEQTRATAAQVLLPVECEGCAYEKVCVRCPMLRSPKLDGHCDPAVCELTRQLVAAGVKKLPEQPAGQ